MRSISYVFPVYNNAESLEPLYTEMRKVTDAMASRYDYEFIFVDDGSADDSWEVLKRLTARDDHVSAYSLSRNFGHQGAVTAALDRATGDAVVVMDADLQDPPPVVPELVAKWEEGYDVVYAQRRKRADSLLKRATASVFYRVMSSLSSVDIPRDTGDFRLIDRKVVDVVREMREYRRYLRGMFSFAGFRHAGVQYDRVARQSGKSEYTPKKLINLAKDGILSYSDAPLRLITRLGLLVTTGGLLGVLVAAFLKLFTAADVPDWTLVVGSVFFIGGVQLVMLGVVGEYVARIYDEVRRRPGYIVAETIAAPHTRTARAA